MPIPPTIVPKFATSASAGRIVEPPSLVRSAGYADGDQPPASWYNYDRYQDGIWFDWLRGPSLHQWSRVTTPATLSNGAVDNVSVDPGVLVSGLIHRIVAIDGTTKHFYTSARGNSWATIVPTFTGPTTPVPTGIFFSAGNRFFCTVNSTSSDDSVWYALPSGTTGSQIDTPATSWVQVTVPAGGGAIPVFGQSIAQNPGTGQMALVTHGGAGIYYAATETGAFVAATLGTAASGHFQSVAWTGAHYIAITSAGEVYRTADASTSWTKITTITSPTIAYAIAADGFNDVLLLDSGIHAYKSSDDGATFASYSLPTLLGTAGAVYFLDGTWFAVLAADMGLAYSADAVNWQEATLPFTESSVNLSTALLVSQGAFLLLGGSGSYAHLGQRALMPSPATNFATSQQTAARHDAAFLQGTLVDPTAPAMGSSLMYDGSTGVTAYEHYAPGGKFFAGSTPGGTVNATVPGVYVMDASTGAWTFNLPDGTAAPLAHGAQFTVIDNGSAGSHTSHIVVNGTQKIQNPATGSLPIAHNGTAVTLVWDSTVPGWWIAGAYTEALSL